MTTRVLVVDDHDVVRRGLLDLLNDEEDLEVTAVAATARQALEILESEAVDVALLDIRLGEDSGIELCRDVRSRFPDVACVIFTAMTGEEALVEAVLAGASGYLLKTARASDLVDAVRGVAMGEQLLDSAAAGRLMDRLRRGDRTEGKSGLTAQEAKVLGLIGEGKTNKEIADSLFLAEQTVKNYVSNIFAKLGVRSRIEAALLKDRKHSSHSEDPLT